MKKYWDITTGIRRLRIFTASKKYIDFCSDKEDIHTKVQPEHADGKGGQTSIGIRVSLHVVNVKGKQEGKPKPSSGSQKSSRQFSRDFGFPVWNEQVQ